MRSAIHLMAPDEDVRARSWYVGDANGRPTQAERIRFIAEQRTGRRERQTEDADDFVDRSLGAMGRSLYTRASRAFHAGTEQSEVRRIANYIVLVLDDLLPR